jgi:hypothetical protein
MDNFNVYLESWQVFYGVVAGSSATLMGLIFLSVSLRLDLLKKSAYREPQLIAWQTFINFFWVFICSIVFLMPELTSPSLGLIILFLGLCGECISSYYIWWESRKHRSLKRGLLGFISLSVCYLGLVISGAGTAAGYYRALIIVAPICVFLIGISIRSAWRLLINAEDFEK